MEYQPNTFIKPSTIHGLGVFASVDIKKGEVVEQGPADYDNHLDEWAAYMRKQKTRSLGFSRGWCLVNHSDTPNTARGENDTIVALRDIAIGEEITEDYNKLPEANNPFSFINQVMASVLQHSI